MNSTRNSAKRTCTVSSTETSEQKTTLETEAKSALTLEFAQTNQTTVALSRTVQTDAYSSQTNKLSVPYYSAEITARTPQTQSVDRGNPVNLDKLEKPTSIVLFQKFVTTKKPTNLSIYIPAARELKSIHPRVYVVLFAIPY